MIGIGYNIEVKFTKPSIFLRVSILSLTLVGLPRPAYGIDFNIGAMLHAIYDTASGVYGAGEDGAVTVGGVANGPSNPYLINTVNSYLTANAAAAATVITVNSAAGFAAANEVLIIQMENADAGKMEFATISSIAGSNITLSSGLTNSYTAANKVQVIRVMHYTNVTINSGGFISVAAYNSGTSSGGVLAMKVSGTLTINDGGGGLSGHISTGGGYTNFASRGFAGGSSGSGSGPGGGTGNNGGTNMTPGSPARLQMGSGGGSAASTGGAGGGVVLVKANSIVLNGNIRADGATPAAGNAGGGSGGTILLETGSLSTSSSCGTISASPGSLSGTGTNGGNGRLFINYINSISCFTGTPSSTTNYQKLQLK